MSGPDKIVCYLGGGRGLKRATRITWPFFLDTNPAKIIWSFFFLGGGGVDAKILLHFFAHEGPRQNRVISVEEKGLRESCDFFLDMSLNKIVLSLFCWKREADARILLRFFALLRGYRKIVWPFIQGIPAKPNAFFSEWRQLIGEPKNKICSRHWSEWFLASSKRVLT